MAGYNDIVERIRYLEMMVEMLLDRVRELEYTLRGNGAPSST